MKARRKKPRYCILKKRQRENTYSRDEKIRYSKVRRERENKIRKEKRERDNGRRANQYERMYDQGKYKDNKDNENEETELIIIILLRTSGFDLNLGLTNQSFQHQFGHLRKSFEYPKTKFPLKTPSLILKFYRGAGSGE